MYFGKILVLYPKRFKTSYVYFNKSAEAIFLLLITICSCFERCRNFKFEAVWIFYVIVSQWKWVSGIDTYEAEIAAGSIIWDLFARKSVECLNLHNSFITVSILGIVWQNFSFFYLISCSPQDRLTKLDLVG